MPVFQETIDSVANANFKSLAEHASVSLAERSRIATDSYARMTILAEKSLQGALSALDQTSQAGKIVGAVAQGKMLADSGTSDLSDVQAQLASGGIAAKQAQSTPGAESQIAALTAQVAASQAQLNALKADMASFVALAQQIMKGAQSTPPETAK